MGEAYFQGLAEHFQEPHQKGKMKLLGKVERHAAEAVRPLLEKYNLKPRPDKELGPIGVESIKDSRKRNWRDLMIYMSERYVGYVDDFEALERMAPECDLPALKILTDHEVAAIEFANLEIAGDGDSAAPLRMYLQA